MSVYVYTMPQKKYIPIIDVSLFGIDVSINTYAKNALEWAKKELVPKEAIYCPCLDDFVYLSQTKINHTILQKKYDRPSSFNEDNISVIGSLEAIIENSEIRYKTTDRKGRKNVLEIVKLKGYISLNDNEREVELLIQNIYDHRDGQAYYHFYCHELL
jgi:hypothetical protein